MVTFIQLYSDVPINLIAPANVDFIEHTGPLLLQLILCLAQRSNGLRATALRARQTYSWEL